MLFKVLMVNFCFSCSKTMIGINPTRNKTMLLVSAKKGFGYDSFEPFLAESLAN